MWLEDDELRKDGGGMGSAAVFALQVALVSRRLAVVALPLLCRFCVMSSPCSVTLLLCFFFQAAVLRARWAVPGGSVVSNDGERDQRERLQFFSSKKNVPPSFFFSRAGVQSPFIGGKGSGASL